MTTAAPPATARPAAHRALRRAVLLVVGIALFVGFVSLGTWQVQRRVWKLDLIERVDQRVHAAPVPLPSASEWPGIDAARHEYLPVTVRGQWLPGKTVFTQAVTALGSGFWVVSALQQDDGTAVLVNRGFIPQKQRAEWAPPAPAAPTTTPLAPPSPVTVQGLIRMTEPKGGFLRTNDPAQQRWFSRDVAAIAQALQLNHAAPFFIDAGLPTAGTRALTAEAVEVAGAAATASTPWPRAGMTTIRFPNSHLVYAITWYGLALMVVGAAWLVVRYERRAGLNGGDAAHAGPGGTGR
ncbi:SURF1 family protein [Acidovorax sp. LjRoot117]|uniref:SURF1 family protein n=1 Tax=Acidovorax sp. LjRoot117 TaxID=3342255 RepID=UPI003F4F8F24